jgi:WD40 repeat protein
MAYYIQHIQRLKLHKASIWAVKWSSFGDFIVSCGIDGTILIWGFFLKIISNELQNRQQIEKWFLKNWNYITFIKSFYFQGSHRRINWNENDNNFCVSSFSSQAFFCKIFFFFSFKTINIIEQFNLEGFSSEIKDCDFSRNEEKIIFSTRDKTIWFWERIMIHKFQCFLILQGHESDIKKILWHPRFSFLISISYEGFIRFFQKKNQETLIYNFWHFSNFSFLDLNFNLDGNTSNYCSAQGDFIILSNLFFHSLEPIKSKKKKSICFFFFDKLSFFTMHFSKSNAFFLISGNEEILHLIKQSKIKSKKKKKKYLFTGIKQNFCLIIKKSLYRFHFGYLNNCSWHPKNENVFVTCGEEGDVNFWSFLKNSF